MMRNAFLLAALVCVAAVTTTLAAPTAVAVQPDVSDASDADAREAFHLLVTAYRLATSSSTPEELAATDLRANGGGTHCAACTIVTKIAYNMAVVHETSIDKAFDKLCSHLPSPFGPACTFVVDKFMPTIIKVIEKKKGPDDVCQALKICTDPTCRLVAQGVAKELRSSAPDARLESLDRLPTGFNPIKLLKELVEKMIKNVANHKPIEDIDGDLHSMFPTLRGSSWRGKDCDDLSADIYPGRAVTTHDSLVDHDCNGIKGSDDATGKAWEDVLCADTGARGVAILGDSAAAHFRVPGEWMTAANITDTTFNPLPFMLANELDHPQLSWCTAHMNDTTGEVSGPVASMYLKMRERNRCNHRDFVNAGVNGARTSSMSDNIIFSYRRDPVNDRPVTVFHALIGNDVCDGHHGMGHMTTPAEFEANVLKTMDQLNGHLPKGSHVVFIGLADGDVLYEYLHDRVHPLGTPLNDVKYPAVYDLLNCLDISPCRGWMNVNKTFRQDTTKRAKELSAVYAKIMAEHKYENFDMLYHDFPFGQVIADWVKAGHPAWELIEPVDGFHPSQAANAMIADVLWKDLIQQDPRVFGGVNPNNARIAELFGEQGGY